MADGSPIVLLPPRSVTIEWLLFTPEERDFYDALRTQSRVKFDAFVAEGRVLNNYAHVLAMLLQVSPTLTLTLTQTPTLALTLTLALALTLHAAADAPVLRQP